MNPDHDQLRALLEDAVSDVEPRRSLDEIRSRTTSSPSRRPWLWGAGGAVLATAATIAAVAVLSDAPGTTDAGPGPGPATQPTTVATPNPDPPETGSPATDSPGTDTTEGGTEKTVPVYYLGATSRGTARLFRDFYRGRSELDPATLAVVVAVEEPQTTDPDYYSPWKHTGVEKVSRENGTIVVRLVSRNASVPVHDRPADMSAGIAELAIQQVVYTAQAALQSRDPVQILLDGRHSDTVLGVPTSEPLGNASADDVLAQVQITSPSEGAQVSSPFTVTGRAAAFEANVQWELMDGNTLVAEGFTTAEECCTLSPYSFQVTAPAGVYTLVVHDEDPSGGEGLPPWRDTKQITVR